MKVLFIRMSSMGDVVLTSGVLAALKEANPKLEIHFLTAPSWAPIAGLMNNIDGLYLIDRKPSRQQKLELLKELPQVDLVVDWQSSPLSIGIAKELGKASVRIKKQSLRRRIFVKTGLGGNQLNKTVVEKYYYTLKENLKTPSITIEGLRPRINSPTLNQNIKLNTPKNHVVLHPYASQKNKQWPYFDKLIPTLINKNYFVSIVGQSSENEKLKAFENSFPQSFKDWTNQTSLQETMDIIASANTVVSTDSGPFHLAVALNIPTLGIFGPTTKELGFMAPFSKVSYLENSTLNCRPCHVHGGNSCPKKHFRCMKDLSTEAVIDKLNSLKQYTGLS